MPAGLDEQGVFLFSRMDHVTVLPNLPALPARQEQRLVIRLDTVSTAHKSLHH